MKIFIGIFFLVFCLFITTKLKIDIVLFKERNNLKINFCVKFNFYLFGIINIKLITLKNNGVYIFGFKIPYQKMKKINNNFKNINSKIIFKYLKKLDVICEKFNLTILLGIENAMINALLISIISSIFSIISGINNKKLNEKNYYYKIIPKYNSNILEFNLNFILSIKIYKIIKNTILKNNILINEKIVEKNLVNI